MRRFYPPADTFRWGGSEYYTQKSTSRNDGGLADLAGARAVCRQFEKEFGFLCQGTVKGSEGICVAEPDQILACAREYC
jgi:hypothetical protein